MPGDKPIGFISDYLCPWCYIAYQHLHQAFTYLGLRPSEYVQLLPLQLYPDLPATGIAKADFKKATLKGIGRVLRAEAHDADVSLHLGKIDFIPNTSKAHQLIFLLSEELQWVGVGRIFTAYFQEGKNISDENTLLDILHISEQHSLSVDHTHAYDALTQQMANLSISVTPSFLLKGQHILSGVQNKERWIRWLERLTSE